MDRITVIDSHTGGEPTRTVIAGGPNLGLGDMAHRLAVFRADYEHFRSAIINEPRGSDVLVGALLCSPVDPRSTAGVIFFNNVGYLGMCGHGTIGVIATLAHMGRIRHGRHVIETPVGSVTATLHRDGKVTVQNVPSHRTSAGVRVVVEPWGEFIGDIAWGGNWFFLSESKLPLTLAHIEELTACSWAIRERLTTMGYPEVDHIELFGPSPNPRAHSRNFVLCPGNAYDRSPCGTGASAKVACLAAEGKLQPGHVWRQESIVGSVFEASYELTVDGAVVPSITGCAYVTAESVLLLNPEDPFRYGITV